MIRPARPDDLDALLAFWGRLSRRTVSFRMLGPVVTMTRAATERLLNIDYVQHLTLLATLDDSVIGIAEYARQEDRPDRAEIAFTIEDVYQGIGLGGLLLEHLAAAARERGIAVFEADVLAENTPMLRAFQGSGYQVVFGEPGSVQHVDIAVDPRRQVLARSDRREDTATRSSLRPLFAPRSVAVVGVSRRERTVGNAIFHNLRNRGFSGPVHAVNPHLTEFDGLPCAPSVRDLPQPLDLAVVAVPAEAVREVLEDCAARDVSAVVVVSTEMGPSGGRGTELVRFARGHGMRLVGPNCMGVVSLRPDVDLVATFSPTIPPRGRVSMASQSGPLGLAVLDHARRLGLGFSGFVSLGDSLDVSPNDLLWWWGHDRTTSVVLLHLETFGNPRKFARVARQIAARKPIITVHPGLADGAGGGSDDAAAGSTDSDAVLSALFTQAGVIRTRTMQEMFDTALLLADQPVPRGRRVAVVTNAEGAGALTAGACRGAGLVLADLSEETRALLRAVRPRADRHPVDLTPNATGDDYRRAMAALLADDGVDAVIALFVPPLVEDAASVAHALVQESTAVPGKPVLASFLSQAGLLDELRTGADRAIPSYLFPEAAAIALGNAARYGEWLRHPAGVAREPAGLKVDRARKLVTALGTGRLTDDQAADLLSCFGLHRADRGPAGQDVTLGVVDDPIFGPVLKLGTGSGYARLFGDVTFRITPVSDQDAEAMVRSLRAYPMLAGLADRPAVDLPALVETILRVSAMVERLPELAELTVDRLRVGAPGEGVVLLDAVVRLAEPTAERIPREATVDPG